MKLHILLCVLIPLALQDSIFHKFLLSAGDSGKCLDGSQGAYYLSEGSGVNKTKFVLHFEGGGWCGGATLASTL